MRRTCGLCLLVTVLAGVTSITLAGNAESTQVARRFSAQFLDGEHEANTELLDATMRGAADAEAWEQLRTTLLSANGAVREVGGAWIEDTVGSLLRLRVPLTFEKATLDFRVVLDDTGKVAGFFVVDHVEPPEIEPAEAGREILLDLGAGERAIPATLRLPQGDGPFPAVVLIHGSGPMDRDGTVGPNRPYRDLALGLAERGVAVLRYDKRSFARPADLVAHGQKLTVQQEVIEDARLALTLLRAREEVDAARIYYAGHSLGGMLLSRIAAVEPRPAGLIALAAATELEPEVILAQMSYIVSLDGQVSEEERTLMRQVGEGVRTLRGALDGERPDPEGDVLGVPVGYFRDLAEHDAPTETAELGLPTLVLQGERDYQVTLHEFARWREALGDKPFACLASYPDLDHLFRKGSGPSGPEDYMGRAAPFDAGVIADIVGWITDRRCPAASPS